MTRFMAPRYFAQDQLRAVETTLERLDIGDEEGRRIFVIALEYELAEYENKGPPEIAPPPTTSADPELLEVAESAQYLRGILQSLTADKREALLSRLEALDLFARGHDERYLAALADQLEGISEACRAADVDNSPSVPALSRAQAQLIDVLAEAYWECFEIDPKAGGGTSFHSLLDGINRICGLGIQLENAELYRILENRRQGGL